MIIISAFAFLPVITEFAEKGVLVSKNFENNSKNNFDKTLNNKNLKLDDALNQTFLFDDILQFDNLINNVSMHGNKIMPYIIPQVKEIDTIEDFKYIQYLVKNNKKYQNTLFS